LCTEFSRRHAERAADWFVHKSLVLAKVASLSQPETAAPHDLHDESDGEAML
jgi:hypothetical protein